MIISETEKEKSQKLANLYRQLEFEEMGVKEARFFFCFVLFCFVLFFFLPQITIIS